jgi:hypothetical protein
VRRAAAGVAVVVAAAMSAFLGLPLLPVDAVGPAVAVNAEQGEQVGWHELVGAVARVWDGIPDAEQDRAVIFTRNYGEAGAIERYRAEFGLPSPYSGHMSYADWGPPADSRSGPVVLVGELGDDARYFADCRVVTEFDNGLGVDNEEQGTDVRLCAGAAAPWSQIWPDLRHYY